MNWLGRLLRRSLDLGRRESVAALWAVAVLSLGIGAVVAFFSVSWAVLYRPLPYPAPDRLYRLSTTDESTGRTSGVTAKLTAAITERSEMIEDTVFFRSRTADLQQGDGAVQIRIGHVSEGFFRLLGARATLGSLTPTPAELDAGSPLAVLSNEFWRSRFGAAPDVVGRRIQLDGESTLIVGVTRPEFRPEEVTQGRLNADWGSTRQSRELLWLVRRFESFVPDSPSVRQYLSPVVRLRVGAEPAAFQSEVEAIAAAAPEHMRLRSVEQIRVVALLESITGPVRPVFRIVMLAGSLVLLICCLNVSSVLVHRWSLRARELGIRQALGAGLSRLAAGVLVESLTLGLVAAGAGLILAFWALSTIQSVAPPGLPRLAEVDPSLSLAAVAVVLALLTGLLSGLPAVLRLLSGRALEPVLACGSVGRPKGRSWLQPLLAGELALTLVILSGVGLLVATLANLAAVDLGFRVEQVQLSSVQLTNQVTGRTVENRNRLFRQLLDRLAGDPEMLFALGPSPLRGGLGTDAFVTGAAEGTMISVNPVSENYFEVMRIQKEAGRLLEPNDFGADEEVVVVGRHLADRLWPGVNPLGQILSFRRDMSEPKKVVGVVKSTHRRGIDRPAALEVYLPFTTLRNMWMDTVVARGPETAQVDSRLKAAAWSIDRAASVGETLPLQRVIDDFFALRRFVTGIVAGFGLLALGISMLGIYAALAAQVSRRRRELAVRMALGADRRRVAMLFVRYAVLLVGPAILLGNLAAVAMGHALESFLFGVEAGDWQLPAAASALLLVSVALACLLPTWRAAALDPAALLRHE